MVYPKIIIVLFETQLIEGIETTLRDKETEKLGYFVLVLFSECKGRITLLFEFCTYN